MKHTLLPILVVCCFFSVGRADQLPNREAEFSAVASSAPNDFMVLPNATNAVQFRLYTNAAPDAPHLFNTFDVQAYGQTLLKSPPAVTSERWRSTAPEGVSLHNIVVNGAGPELGGTNSMTVVEQASGSAWRYLALDATAAYHGRLGQFRRAILFVEPDLFVLYDHLTAKEPFSFRMFLHPPEGTTLDPDWGDLRFAAASSGFRIHAPSGKRFLRSWKRVASTADEILPGTVTMELGPTNKLTQLDLLTVFAVFDGRKRDYTFRLLESYTAIGARIQRDGLPTLVAFKTDPVAQRASLTGFEFTGSVGVDVFRPTQRR